MAVRTVREATANAARLIIMVRTAREAMASVAHIIMARTAREATANAVHTITTVARIVRAVTITTAAAAEKASSIWIMPSAKKLLFPRIHPVKIGETIKIKRSR